MIECAYSVLQPLDPIDGEFFSGAFTFHRPWDDICDRMADGRWQHVSRSKVALRWEHIVANAEAYAEGGDTFDPRKR